MILYFMLQGIGNYGLLKEPDFLGPSQALLSMHSLLGKDNSLSLLFNLDTAQSNKGYVPWPISLRSLLRLFS